MRVLMNAEEIREVLHELQPSSVAVAYVGLGWENYVSATHLREIVLSPTLGSNPLAIEEIIRKLGAENVYFLDSLHSKIYLGVDAALLGSCNLSNNGLSDDGRFEVAIVLTNKEARQQLAIQIECYKEEARKLYPTWQKKLNRLCKLKEQSDKAQWFGMASVGGESPSLSQYKSKLDRIHVIWWGSEGDKYDQSQICKTLPTIKNSNPDDYFLLTFQFLEIDKVQEGDWVLYWHCNNNGLPRKGGDVGWMYVHHVVSGGFNSDVYPKLAGQARSKFLKCPAFPFKLDKRTKALIRKTIGSGQFRELLPFVNSTWRLGPADIVTKAFIDTLKKAS